MRVGIAQGVAAAIGCIGLTTSAPAPRAADLVPLHVAVDGAAGATLTRDDFEVAIDGRPVTIANVTPPPSPLTIVLLLDTTNSMETYGRIDDEIGQTVVPALGPGDRIRVGGIAREPTLAPAFSSNPRDILAASRAVLSFRREDRYGPSPIWDAMDRALDVLEPESGLRALILVSDGRGTGNRYEPDCRRRSRGLVRRRRSGAV